MSEEIFQIGDAGHSTKNENQAEMNQDLTYKLRLKVLQGRFDPDYKDRAMIRAYKETELTPEEFLKTWKG